MPTATKPTVAKPNGLRRPTTARSSLRRPPADAALPPVLLPDANGEDALARALATLGKGAILGVLLMAAALGAYVFVFYNQHKSMAEIVDDLIARPPPKLASRITACPAPALPRGETEQVAFSSELADTLSRHAGNAEAVTQFIVCAITQETQRLCAPDARAALAADLKLHAQLIGQVKTLATGARSANPGDRVDRTFIDGIRLSIATAIEAADREVTRADAIAPTIARLASAGLLAASDFGLFGYGAPAGLRDALSLAAAPPPRCQADTR